MQSQRSTFLLDRWLIPLAPGLGLWVFVQFAAYSWFGLSVTPWLPMSMACLGWGRLALIWRAQNDLTSNDDPLVQESEKSNLWQHQGWLGALLILHLILLLVGSLGHPLPGSDPWEHCLAALYIQETGSLYEPFEKLQVIHFADAYPPGLPVLTANAAGGMAELSLPSALIWINALCATLILAWFHALARVTLGSLPRALAATAVLAAMPSFLMRHPWGHTQAVGLIVAVLFFLIKIWRDEREPWLGSVLATGFCLCGSVFFAPSQGLKAGFLAVLLFFAVLISRAAFKTTLRIAAAGMLAFILVMGAWLGPMLGRYHTLSNINAACMPTALARRAETWEVNKQLPTKETRKALLSRPLYAIGGSGDRVYGWYDFLGFGFNEDIPEAFAPVGCGGVAFLLSLIGMVALFSRRPACSVGAGQNPGIGKGMAYWLLLSFLFAFVGVHGSRLPLRLFPWRFWFLLSIFVALLAIPGWLFVRERVASKTARRFAGGVAILGLSVSLAWKVKLAVMPIRPTRFFHALETEGYREVAHLVGAKSWIYPLAGEGRFDNVIGSGMRIRFWAPDDYRFAAESRLWSPEQTSAWLSEHGYAHCLLDPAYGLILLRGLMASNSFSLSGPEYQVYKKYFGGSPPKAATAAGLLKDPRVIPALCQILVARKANELERSGRFKIVYNNGWVVCLAVKQGVSK